LSNQLLLLVDYILKPAFPEPELTRSVSESLAFEPELDRNPRFGSRVEEMVDAQYELDLCRHLQKYNDNTVAYKSFFFLNEEFFIFSLLS
jgi:hypothetical protein